MDKKLFERLYESMTQMNEIIDGECIPSRCCDSMKSTALPSLSTGRYR
jgi:hypothetical protein